MAQNKRFVHTTHVSLSEKYSKTYGCFLLASFGTFGLGIFEYLFGKIKSGKFKYRKHPFRSGYFLGISKQVTKRCLNRLS